VALVYKLFQTSMRCGQDEDGMVDDG
jgi:hypothetical protein